MANTGSTPAPRARGLPDRLSGSRTVAFLITLAGIFGTARGGASRAVIVVAFALFTITATLWVRGQHHDSLDGRRWVLPTGWTVALGAATAAVLAYWALLTFTDIAVAERVEQAGTALLIVVVLLYLLVGFLLVRWRASGAGRARWGLAALALGTITGGSGLLLLGRADTGWSLALLAIALFSLPPGVALLSEVAIEKLQEPGARRRTWAAGGGALLVVSAGVAYLRLRTPLVVLAFGALGLLVLALVSSTLADIAAVLALIAFMGITPRQVAPPPDLEPAGRSDVLVALGDSYMSGEGAATFYEGTDDGGRNGCRRSPTAWAAIVGQHDFGGLDFLACSGARTYNVREPNRETDPRPHRQYDEPGTQLRQYERLPADERYTPALVVLSIGGNDVGFATIGQMCVAPGDCSTQSDLWLGALDDVEEQLEETYDEVLAAFPDGTPVAVVPYPNPIYSSGDGTPPRRCGQVSLLFEERTFINDFVTQLNQRIERAVASRQDPDLHYVAGMEEALANEGLQLCDPINEGRPGLNFIGLRSVNGDPSQRFNPSNWVHNSLHPNERGHAAMVRVFQQWWEEREAAEGTPPVDHDRRTDVPASVPRVCDVYGDLAEKYYSRANGNGCRSQGTAWALQQLGGTAFWGSVAAGSGALGAWSSSVAFFAWRRRRWVETRPLRGVMPPATQAG